MNHKSPNILLTILLSSVLLASMASPPARASGGLTIDGTGAVCATSSINATILQDKGCGPGSPGIPLCASHPGGFCPLGDLVILQILLNNTGTVTKVVANQGLDQWWRRASVLNGQGGRMEEWYATTTGPVSGPAIYITETVSPITVAAQEFAISGYDPDAPFDSNTSLPSNSTGTSNVISTIINTSHPEDLLLALEYGGAGTIIAGDGFTGVCLSASPCQFDGLSPNASESLTINGVQSSYDVSMSQTNRLSWGLIVDSVKASSPAVSSVSPTLGVTGSQLTIKGISLNETIDVKFCGTSQPSFTVVNDTTITTIAPQLQNPPNSQVCDIAVTTREGSSAITPTDRFWFKPKVLGITPSTGGVGTSVTISGTSFTGATSVSICGVSQPRITVTNDTQILTTVPGITLLSPNQCSVTVTNSNAPSNTPTGTGTTFAFQPQARAAPTSTPPLLSGKTWLLVGLTILSVALLTGSRMIRKNDIVDIQHQPR